MLQICRGARALRRARARKRWPAEHLNAPQVVGCCEQLVKQYEKKKQCCRRHLQADAVLRRGCEPGQLWRFCQQCGKLEPLELFEGLKRCVGSSRVCATRRTGCTLLISRACCLPCRSCCASLDKRRRTSALPGSRCQEAAQAAEDSSGTSCHAASSACSMGDALSAPARGMLVPVAGSGSFQAACVEAGLPAAPPSPGAPAVEPVFEALLAELMDEHMAEHELESMLEQELRAAAASATRTATPGFSPAAPAAPGPFVSSNGGPGMQPQAPGRCCNGACRHLQHSASHTQALWARYTAVRQQLMITMQQLQQLGLLSAE